MNIQEFSRILNGHSQGNVLRFQDEFMLLMKELDTQSIVASQLRNCLENYKTPPPIVYESTLQLINGDWFSVDLTVNLNRVPSPVVHTHADGITVFLSTANYTKYALHNFTKSSFSSEAYIHRVESGTFSAGDVIAIQSNRDALTLYAEDPMIYVSLSNKFYQGITWRFDAASGRPVSHFNSSPTTTVLEMISKFLGLYGDPESIGPLKLLLSHESESVRWEAASALAHLDAQEGIQAFNDLASSDSPELAKAARRTLEVNHVAL